MPRQCFAEPSQAQFCLNTALCQLCAMPQTVRTLLLGPADLHLSGHSSHWVTRGWPFTALSTGASDWGALCALALHQQNQPWPEETPISPAVEGDKHRRHRPGTFLPPLEAFSIKLWRASVRHRPKLSLGLNLSLRRSHVCLLLFLWSQWCYRGCKRWTSPILQHAPAPPEASQPPGSGDVGYCLSLSFRELG